MDSMYMHNPASLPLVTLEGDTEFDYAAFFQGELGESSSSASTSTISDAAASGFPVLSTATVNSKAKSKQTLERRGHTKSRRGCFNCKRRRVKCQETRPACGHCVKAGLQCEYPAVPLVVHQPQNQIPLFSLQDMRFFQHFLTACLPSHPLGNESIWSHEVLCLSQNYQYLMHAILGFAASDLIRKDRSLVTSAMMHRVKAISAIKKSLANAPKSGTFEEGNALLATCFALTFQSVSLEDGMAEYMTFCRGVLIVAIQMYCKGSKFIFNNLIGDDKKALLEPLMETIAPIRREWTDMAVASIAALEPLCKHQVEVEYRQLLKEWAETLYTNSFQAYLLLSKHYGWWLQIPHERFAYLIDPGNQVCLLLATHWIALKKIMATITDAESRVNPSFHSQDDDPDIGIGRWLKYLNRQIDDEHREYNQWPMWVEKQLERDLDFFRRP